MLISLKTGFSYQNIVQLTKQQKQVKKKLWAGGNNWVTIKKNLYPILVNMIGRWVQQKH